MTGSFIGRADAAVLALVAGLALLIGCATSDPATTTSAAAATSEPTADVVIEATNGSADAGPIFHAVDNPDSLAGWGQLGLIDGALRLSDGVTPYELNSALFSDHAQKLRTVWIASDAPAADYSEADVFSFPVGTVITKTFYYSLADGAPAGSDRVRSSSEVRAEPVWALSLDGVRLIETRVLVHREDGWDALPYVWNAEQTDASLQRTGDLLQLTFVDASDASETSFPYVVPNANQCAGCHATDHTRGEVMPIGPKARHLNRDVAYRGITDGSAWDPINQLDAWRSRGLLVGGPDAVDAPRSAVWTDETQPLDERARAYLDINCAHCHNSVGPADTSGLFLEPSTDLGPHLGVCKAPIAAGTGTGGRRYGIVPGEPDESIFVFRLSTTDPASMMPELGRALTDDAGVALVAGWIESLAGSCT